MFKVGDRIVHPLHGAGIIDKIEYRPSAEGEKEFYSLKFASGDMSVSIPADKCQQVGVRPVISQKLAKKILTGFAQLDIGAEDANWNKRYRDNMLRIKSGDPMEVAAVVKCLMIRAQDRELSTGEKRMLRSAKDILVSEMTMSMDLTDEEIENQLAIAVG